MLNLNGSFEKSFRVFVRTANELEPFSTYFAEKILYQKDSYGIKKE